MTFSRLRNTALLTAVVVLVSGFASSAWAKPTSPLGFGSPVRVTSHRIGSLSCPSTRACVAVDGGGGWLSSTRPAAGARAWKRTMLPAGVRAVGIRSISCPSAKLCVGFSAGGDVVSSRDPLAARPHWSITLVSDPSTPPFAELTSIDCPLSSLCVVTDSAGAVITSTDPTGPAAAWQTSLIDHQTSCDHYGDCATPALQSVTCVTASRCVALDVAGNTMQSSDPAGGPSAWRLRTVTDSGPETVWAFLACTTTVCLASQDEDDGIYADRGSGAGIMPVFSVGLPQDNGADAITALACPSSSLCLAGDQGTPRDAGGTGKIDLYTSTNPSSSTSWADADTLAEHSPSASLAITAISCPSSRLCVASDNAGAIIVGTPSPAHAQPRR